MKEITLTVNGKQLKGREGDTVLEVCEANSIYVPTLCHLKGLTDGSILYNPHPSRSQPATHEPASHP